jgi:hypothetical protein
MLNSRLVESGPTKLYFTKENIQKTYAEKDPFLEEASALFERAKTGKG